MICIQFMCSEVKSQRLVGLRILNGALIRRDAASSCEANATPGMNTCLTQTRMFYMPPISSLRQYPALISPSDDVEQTLLPVLQRLV